MGGALSVPAGTSQSKSLYAILGVERNADDEELKRAYRRAALRLHPDKNRDALEEAADKFSQLQAAYDILKDPQERSWYDNKQNNKASYDYTSKTTSAEQIRAILQPEHINSVINKPDIYEEVAYLFEMLKNEELEAAFESDASLADIAVSHAPPFGDLHSPKSSVRAFYDTWSSFATRKSFSWVDAFPVHHAEDRRERRTMEGHNKKLRTAAKREFNDSVRRLVSVVRANDQRLKSSEPTKKPAPAPAAKKTVVTGHEEEWTKLSEDSFQGLGSDIQNDLGDCVECIVCELKFKSSEDLESHELEPKHRKLLKQMQSQMLEDDAIFSSAGKAASNNMGGSNRKKSQATQQPIIDETKESSVESLLSQLDSLRVDRGGRGAKNSTEEASGSKKLGKAKQKKLKKQQYQG